MSSRLEDNEWQMILADDDASIEQSWIRSGWSKLKDNAQGAADDPQARTAEELRRVYKNV
jgi:hypothetical protein